MPKSVRNVMGRAEGTLHLRHHLDRLSMLVLQGVPVQLLDANTEHKKVLSYIPRQQLDHSPESKKGQDEGMLTLMASTSDEHPPTLTPILHTVPFHSHVLAVVTFSTRSPLVPLTLRFLLNLRVRMESARKFEKEAALCIGMSSPDLEMVPEGKDFNTP